MEGRYLVKKAFMFTTYNGCEPVRVGEGNLVSYEVYTRESHIECNNAIKITVYGPDGDIILDGPNKTYLGDYLREIEYSDLVHSKEYMFEQQKNRTYRKGQKDNTVVVELKVDAELEENEAKKENIECIIRYLDGINQDKTEPRIREWIESEKERLRKEHDKLSILTSSDDEIIQNALLYYSNDCLAHHDTETANKIRDVRERYLKGQDKDRYITRKELSEWTSAHKGEWRFDDEIDITYTSYACDAEYADEDLYGMHILVRKHGDEEWHNPLYSYCFGGR